LRLKVNIGKSSTIRKSWKTLSVSFVSRHWWRI
jgi:hypothetical protein